MDGHGSVAETPTHFDSGSAVGDALPGRQLLLGDADVAQELELIQHVLVSLDVEEDSGTASSLCEDDGAVGIPHLLDDRSDLRPDLGEWANVLRPPCTVDCTRDRETVPSGTGNWERDTPAPKARATE